MIIWSGKVFPVVLVVSADYEVCLEAVGSAREQTASTADLYQAYPEQATEAEAPPVADCPEDC